MSDDSIDRITEDALAAKARVYGLSAEGLSVYRAAHPGASPGDLLSAIQTDWYWRIPASEVPTEREQLTEWLFEWWERIDRWVQGHLEPEGSEATDPSGRTVSA